MGEVGAMLDFNKLSELKLSEYPDHDPRFGGNSMDRISYLQYGHAGERPECVCPVIAEFICQVDRLLPNKERQKLAPYLLRFLGTVSKEHERQRAEYLAWQAITVFAPLALKAVGLTKEADKLKSLDQNDLEAAQDAAKYAERIAVRAAEEANEDLDGVITGVARSVEAAGCAAKAAAIVAVRIAKGETPGLADTPTGAAAYAACCAGCAASGAAEVIERAACYQQEIYDAVFKAINELLTIGPGGGVNLLPVEASARLEKLLELQKEWVAA